jgi:hypothetical protein
MKFCKFLDFSDFFEYFLITCFFEQLNLHFVLIRDVDQSEGRKNVVSPPVISDF